MSSVGAGDPSAHLRPTSDRVRESLFNVLRNYDLPASDISVLDLFAGTGALALEALSRGAASAVLVDDGRTAQRLIRENIKKTRRTAQATLLTRSATALPEASSAFGLVFMDPPYGMDLGGRALGSALAGGWLTDDAVVVWEENAPQPTPQGFDLLDQRRYGDTWITILRRI